MFAAFNIDGGTDISHMHRRHRSIELKKFLAKIDPRSPPTGRTVPDTRLLRCWTMTARSMSAVTCRDLFGRDL